MVARHWVGGAFDFNPSAIEFLKDVLKGKKYLIRREDKVTLHVPHYDERKCPTDGDRGDAHIYTPIVSV